MTPTTTDDLEGMLDRGSYLDEHSEHIPRVPLAYAKKLAEFMELYRDLLRKYIAHIIDCEGSDYFSFRDHPFTPQELEELKRLSEEKI